MKRKDSITMYFYKIRYSKGYMYQARMQNRLESRNIIPDYASKFRTVQLLVEAVLPEMSNDKVNYPLIIKFNQEYKGAGQVLYEHGSVAKIELEMIVPFSDEEMDMIFKAITSLKSA